MYLNANSFTGVAKLLLRCGATILFPFAISFTGVAELLLRCDPTALFLTVFSFTGVAELLLRCGATVDSLDLLKMTPLHWAAENGHFAVCRLLLNKGADPLAESKVAHTDI